MSLTVKSDGDFTPCVAGNHVGTCYSVIDLGLQHNPAWIGSDGTHMPESDKHQILITWEIPAEMVETDEGEKPSVISNFYTASFHEKANLLKHLEAWRGRAFTQDELAGFNIGKVLGKACMINVVHTDKGKARISGIAALPKGFAVPPQINDSIMFDLSDYDQAVFDSISEGIQNIIKRSPEWKAINEVHGFRQDDDFETAGPDAGFSNDPAGDNADPPPWPDDGQEIPF